MVFRLPEETVIGMWRRAIGAAYAPEAIYRRFVHNLTHTFARRPAYPRNPRRASRRNVVSGLALSGRIVWRIGVRGRYPAVLLAGRRHGAAPRPDRGADPGRGGRAIT